MSVVFTHDMLAWNNARWSWVNNRLDHGFEARDIDAGRDVNAWLRMDEDENLIFFEANNKGMISTCGYFPKNCADDCFTGITITEIKN